MHNTSPDYAPGKIFRLAGILLLAFMTAACGQQSTIPATAPVGLDPRIDDAPPRAGIPAGGTARPEDPRKPAPESTAGPAPNATRIAGDPFRAPSSPSFTAGPSPTPHPGATGWVNARLDAVIALYNVTDAGAALIRSLDVRHMRGEPGFFGSYGFHGWAGVGEAKPISVMHELGHSYWGGFPVAGMPGLSWDIPPGEDLSPAMRAYHDDVLLFMAQPPDGYEVLRDRMRNLPNLSRDNLEPLLHHAEADLVYNTGGNLALTPPILRKYWTGFLRDGPFGSWHDAISWYRSLPAEDRATANKYVGFEHLDLRRYPALAPLDGIPVEGGADIVAARRGILAREERQRLFDLADQFDLLLGDPGNQENFQFWRGYLRDKLDLHRQYPDFLASLNLPRSGDLSEALDFLAGLRGKSSTEQVDALSRQLPGQPFLVHFLPALDNSTLLGLFTTGTELPRGETLRATAAFVQRLDRFTGVVRKVLAMGRDDPRQGAAELRRFLVRADFGPDEDLRLFLELLLDDDRRVAANVVGTLDRETVRRLMKPAPAQARALLTPGDLTGKLDITTEAGVAELRRGISILARESSGNFIIDEPFLEEMYRVMARRSDRSPQETLEVIRDTPFPLEGFIRQEPAAAVAVLAGDPAVAVDLVKNSDPVLAPPARLIYRLVYADPALAARLVSALDAAGEEGLVVESLAHIAYDKHRTELLPELPVSLARDGEFLEALLRERGADWLTRRLEQAIAEFSDRASRGRLPSDFPAQYRATLEAAASAISSGELQGIVRRLIADAGDGR